MDKAIVDTTVLTDILLNSGEVRKTALKALNCYSRTYLPVYAIKEFKAGPLSNFIWFYNKLVLTGSFSDSILWLQKMSRTPRRYTTSTAIQALHEAAASIRKRPLKDFVEKYGDMAEFDKVSCDEIRLSTKYRIISAWKRRRKVTTDIIGPLPCYREESPYEKKGLLEKKPINCLNEHKCSMAAVFQDRPEALRQMLNAIKASKKDENKKRSKILRKLLKNPNISIDEKDCGKLGDAAFTILSPPDAVILSTNISDHSILAESIGIKAVTPQQVTSLASK